MKMPDFFVRLTDNLPIKLLAVAAAVLLYFSYQITTLDSKSFSIPLQVREGGSFALADDPPQYVRVTVRAKPEQTAAVQKGDITAYIDTSSVTASGVSSLSVKLGLKDYFTLMDPLDVQVKPNTISLHFEQNAAKSVPVKAFFLGSLPEGYEIVSQTVDPENVKIVGAQSVVDAVESVSTVGIDLQNKTESFTATVKIETDLRRVQVTDVQDVTVRVEIKAQALTRSFSVRAQALNLNAGLELAKELDKVTLTLSGTKNALSSFTPGESAVQADFSDAHTAGIHSVQLRVNIPDEFSVVAVDPPVLEAELAETSSDFSSGNFREDL